MLKHFKEANDRLAGIANKTPVMTSRTLNALIKGCQVYLKCENFQRIGAFKFRGAYNTISQLSDKEKKRGVVTHSSGNHAQAVALVGNLLDIKTVIVMPNNAPQVKVAATRGYGAEIVFSEPSVDARAKMCNDLISKFGYTLVHPYDNLNVIYGAGTTALELLDEVGELDYLYAPIGGGGLMSGSSCYAKESEKVRMVIGAEPENADDAYRSIKYGELITYHEPNTIADGLRTLLSPLTFDFVKKYVDEIILVTDAEIIEAMRFLWERMKIVVEPSGAVSLAALLKMVNEGRIEEKSKVGVILSGGNADLTDYFNTML
ncbi:MAG: pyridoxal-phosphate dependent enzyme [Candidatus Kariarchaeaceae archaeon]|jgi:threonine dehydratase